MKFLIVFSLLLSALATAAQPDSTGSPLAFSGYAEAYYLYDFNKPADHNRPAFAYSFNRHNEVNLNLGFVKAAYAKPNLRANLALMAGTYANANLAAEPGVLRNVLEANAGVKISKTNDLWIDAGIFASHIGFESAAGKDCWNLTRSIAADNSPYYESGLKIGYTSDDGRWFLSALLLNGWQRIQRPDGNNTPAFGHQLTFKPNGNITLNSSSFVGNDKPDSLRQMRYFHNFYGIFQVNNRWAFTLGFDFGAEETARGSGSYNTWYTPVVMARYSASDKLAVSVRGEYYHDSDGVIIATGTRNGFQTWSYSANLDYAVSSNVVWRIEARGFSSRDEIFTRETDLSTQNFFIVSALAVSF